MSESKQASEMLDVLIVGAGPTGLVLALELARRNINFRIIDKSSGPSTTSKALAVHSRSLEVFKNMGIVDKFLDKGIELRNVDAYADGKKIVHFSFEELDSEYPFALSLPQYITEEIIINALSEKGKQVERETELVALENGDHHASATIKNNEGKETKIDTRWLVGCDGAHSTVRHQLGLEFHGEKYPETWILGDVHAESPYQEDTISLFNSEDGLLAFFPYGNKRFRVVADQPNSEKSENETSFTEYTPPKLEELQSAVDNRAPEKIVLSDPKWTSAFSIHRRHVSKYRIKRVFLAGDAAHIHSPAGGQGMNTGIQDSYNLGWKLHLALNDRVNDKYLDSYEDERLAIAISVLKMTDFITKVNTLRNPIAKKIRNKIAPILSAQEVVQKRAQGQISELDLNYRKSPIVKDEFQSVIQSATRDPDLEYFHEFIDFKNGPRAGDRAPDGFLVTESGDNLRLFDLLKGREHVLLIFNGPHQGSVAKQIESIDNMLNEKSNFYMDTISIIANQEELEQYKSVALLEGNEVYLDWELSCHHSYGAASSCLYLLRPDGYVGYRCQPINSEKLKNYLDKTYLTNKTIEISAK